jgi:hypothetical protein
MCQDLIVNAHNNAFCALVLTKITLNTDFDICLMTFHKSDKSLEHRVGSTQMARAA